MVESTIVYVHDLPDATTVFNAELLTVSSDGLRSVRLL